MIGNSVTFYYRSGGNEVDNALDYRSRDRKIDPPLLRSFGRGLKPRSRLRMTSLVVGCLTRVDSLTLHYSARMSQYLQKLQEIPVLNTHGSSVMVLNQS